MMAIVHEYVFGDNFYKTSHESLIFGAAACLTIV